MIKSDSLKILYKFYNKKLYDLDDNGQRTPEQDIFANYTSKFWEKNYEIWSNSMNKIAEATNTIFWDTTFFNRQSFSCYFVFDSKEKVLIIMSRLINIYYIDDETNSKTELIDLLTKEMSRLHPTYLKASEEELMISLKPYFECFSSPYSVDHTLYNAFLGYKPSL